MRLLPLLVLAACVEVPVDSDQPEAPLADAGPDRVVQVGVAVKLDGRGSIGGMPRWQAGDGRTYEQLAPTLIYDAPGTYTAVLTITTPEGAELRDSATVVVHPELAEEPSSTSSTILLDEGSVLAIVRDANQLVRIDPNGQVQRSQACFVGRPVALTSDAVLCDEGVQQGSTFTPLPVGAHPGGMVADGDALVITLRGTGQLATLRNGSFSFADTLADPRALVNLAGETIPARWRSDGVGEVGTHTLAFDPGPDTDTGSRGVPNLLTLAASPDGRTLFAAGTLANTARGTFRDGLPLTFESTVRGFFSVIDVSEGETLRRQFDNQGLVGALAVDPLGTRVFVAFPTTDTVFVIDPITGTAVGSLLEVGHGVTGLVTDGQTLFVNAELSREVVAYDIRDLSGLPDRVWAVTSVETEPLSPQVLRGKVLFNASTRRLSKHGYVACATCHPGGDHDGQTWDFTDRGEGLRNTTTLLGRAGTGMGPVHWSGNFDEIQDFEHDIRGPFEGEGLLDDFSEADSPLGPPKAGRSEDLDALAAYVASLTTTPASPFPASPTGQAAFLAAGCAECHPAPLYTDSALDVRHDVGTLTDGSGGRLGGPLDGLDTPTLLGTWDTGPWLHDGSAATVREAIEAHHGVDPVQIELITAFVLSL